jgi:hypothetical protein
MNYAYIRDDSGSIIGFWLADPSLGLAHESARDLLSMVITAAMIRDGCSNEQITPLTARIIAGDYRSAQNTVDNRGGCFILLSDQALAAVSRPQHPPAISSPQHPPAISSPQHAPTNSLPRRPIIQSLRRELESLSYSSEDPNSDHSIIRRYQVRGALAGGILGGILMTVIAAFQPIDGKPGYQLISTKDYSFLLAIGFTFVAGAMGLGYVGAKVGVWLGKRAVRNR